MSKKLMEGLYPTVKVKKTTVAACKASGDNKSKCNSLTFHDLENRKDYLSKNESQKAKVACVWEKESCTSKEKCCIWHSEEPIEGNERGVKGCKKCSYTGKKSNIPRGETKNRVRAADVMDNRIMAFISSVSKCNELFPEVNSQAKYDAKLALYKGTRFKGLSEQRQRNKYIGCIMHCLKNLEADRVSIDDVMLSAVRPLIDTVIPEADLKMIVGKYRDNKKTDNWGEISEIPRQFYLRFYNEATDPHNYGLLPKPDRNFPEDHPSYNQRRENIELNIALQESEDAIAKGSTTRTSKFSRRGGKRRRTKRKKKRKKRRKSRRKKKRKTKKYRIRGG